MIKEGKFGVQEAVCLVTITICTKIFFTSPAFLTRLVGTAVWYTTLISAATAIVAFTIVYLLLKRFPGKNLIEVFDNSMGRFFGFIFSFAFAVLFLMDAGMALREFTEVLRTYTFQYTQSSLIEGAFVITVGIAAFSGLESIARVSRLLGFILLFTYILAIAFSAQNFHLKYLFPILGYGLDKTVIHGLVRSSVYGEVVVLAVFASSLQGIKNIKKAGYISLILSGIILSLGLLSFIMVFPYFSLEELTAPMYSMTRLIKYGTFFTRIDPLFLLLWNISTFISLSVLFYAAVSIYCKIFRLQDKRPIIVPMTVVFFASTMAPRDFSSIVYGVLQQFREYSWVIFFGLPLIAFITAVLRKKKGEKSNA